MHLQRVYFSKLPTWISPPATRCNPATTACAYCFRPTWGSSKKFRKYNPPRYSQVQTHNICSKFHLQTSNATTEAFHIQIWANIQNIERNESNFWGWLVDCWLVDAASLPVGKHPARKITTKAMLSAASG